MKTNLALVICLIILGIISLVQFIGLTTKSELLFEECQPNNFVYDDFGPYCVYIIQDYSISADPLKIRIMRQDNYLNGPFTEVNYLSNKFDVSKFDLEWSESGIRLSVDSTKTLLVEKEAFIGGR